MKTYYTISPKVALISALLLLIVVGAAASARADTSPDSISAIQPYLPDSLSLSGKVVYVDFWASWCVPCRQSFPWMQNLYEKYHKKGLEIIAVSVDKDHRSALEFLNDNKVLFPVVFDSTGSLAKQYKLKAMPTSFLYDRSGHLVTTNLGFELKETDSLDYAVLHLVNEGKAK